MLKNNFRKNTLRIVALSVLIGAAQLVMGGDANAIEDFSSVRANTAVKVIALDLSKCYENAQETVLFSDEGITNFSGNKFWKDSGLEVPLPQVLYGKNARDKNEATCADLITGWHTNWFVNLFTGDGKFTGLIKDSIVVPDNSNEHTYYLSEQELKAAKQKLQQYLVGVGYEEQKDSSATLNGYKCFYAKFNIPARNLSLEGDDDFGGFIGFMFPPLNGENVFSSSENFCFYVDDNGNVDYKNHMISYRYDSFENNGETMYINRENDASNHIRIYYADNIVGDYIWQYNPYASDDKILISTDKMYAQYNSDSAYDDWYPFWREVAIANYQNTLPEACPGRMDDYGLCYLLTSSDEEITYAEVKNRVKQFIENQVYDDSYTHSSYPKVFSNVEIVDIDMGSISVSYTKGDKLDFIQYFVNVGSDYSSFTKEEQYMFYYDHLKDYFKVEKSNNNSTSEGDRVEVYWLNEEDNSFEKKYLYSDNTKKKAKLLCDTKYSDPHWCTQGAEEGTWKDFANKLAELSSDKDALARAFENANFIDTEYNDLVEEDSGVVDPATKAAQDPCYTSSDSLGWIICPIVKTATKAMMNMYDNIEKDFLVVESELTSTNSATREAWSIFVSFANIVMVILLLVVIISQITGAGIDNYGIKKLLPKIITVAILINLSFIICQLAVDISNIVGSSVKDLLVNTSKNTSLVAVSPCKSVTGYVAPDCGTSAGWFKALVTIAGGGIVGLGGASLVQGIIGNGILDGLIIPILILVLVAVIAVIFFFILLGLRKAAIVILIVISPLAFICYALPNTKKLFTKWFDAMKGMLLLYPICGLIIGGGTLASKIILSASHDYVSYFIGTIIMVVPFFMVPSLLKSSFQALGGIGAKISGLGKSLRTRTQTRANKVHQNTAGYKARQGAHQAEFANRVKFRQAEIGKRRADRTIDRLEKKKDSGKELSEREQARLYDATNTANQYENTKADYRVGVPKIDKGIAQSRAESRLQAQETKLWSEQLAKADTKTITTEFEDSLKTGNVAKMSAAFEALKNTGNLPKIHDALENADWGNMSKGMRLALNQSMIGSGDVAMKAYAKESFKNDNKGNFRNFMEGVDTDGLGTIQGSLQKLGSHALDGQNKDTVDFIARHTSSLGNDDWVAKMIMSGLTSTQNGEEKAKFKDMLKNYKAQSSSDAAFAENIKKAINASTLAKMDSGSFDELNKLLGGSATDYSAINSVLGDTIRELQQANNATLYASLSNDIKSKLSAQPQSQPQEIQVPHNPQSTQTPHNPQSTQSSDQTPIEVETNFFGDGSGIDG